VRRFFLWLRLLSMSIDQQPIYRQQLTPRLMHEELHSWLRSIEQLLS
jgi:hypothetical protein